MGLAGDAGTLRLVFSRVEVPADPETLEPGQPATRLVPTDQAEQHPGFQFRYRMLDGEQKTARETRELMDGTVDSWTEENQARADQGLGPTDDVRGLYHAMSVFLDATETPVPGAVGLYVRIRHKCRAWMDQAVAWFPALYPPFIRGLIESQYYKEAVEAGYITPPFTWNHSIKDLALWLENSKMLSKPNDINLTDRTKNNWMLVDGVFEKDGKPVTAQQLGNAIKH